MTLKCTMILGDCLDVMPTLPKSSAEMVFADLPYATTNRRFTALRWDVPADIASVWNCLSDVGCARCVHIFTANIPLAALLYANNPGAYRYDLVHAKQIHTGFLSADTSPLRSHESILVFCREKCAYIPQMNSKKRARKDNYGTTESKCYSSYQADARTPKDESYPISIISPKWEIERFRGAKRSLHPTQKPIALLDWLIRTYSNPGDNVLDPVSGSFTTCVSACQNGRSSVGIEKDPGYFEAGVERVRKTCVDQKLDVDIEVRR